MVNLSTHPRRSRPVRGNRSYYRPTPTSAVCCEREAVEAEGAGHDEWCPTVTASNHSGGDAS